MKIYFNASMSAKDQFGDSYKRIVQALRELGHEVMDEHIINYDLKTRDEETPEERRDYYNNMKKRIKNADLMVAEISYPSTVHVGHELTLALDLNKPVLALYQTEFRPVLFWGLDDDRFMVVDYNNDNLETVIERSVKDLADQIDTRFNFFISPRHINYLDYVAREKRIPRSVFLRRLIEEDMSDNEEYQNSDGR